VKANMTEQLSPDEQTLLRTRPAWRSFAVFFFGMALCLIGPWLREDPPLRPATGLVFAAIFFLIILRRWSNVYTLTTKRLRMRGGLLARDSIDILLSDIAAVETHQGFTLRLLKAGHVLVRSKVPNQENILIYGLPDPEDFKARLEQLAAEVQARRQSASA